MPSSDLLTGWPQVSSFAVLWGDEDSFGHVNNLVYLRWAETARIEYFRHVGIPMGRPPDQVGPILAHIACDYRLPLNYPDTVRVGTRVVRIGNSSIGMEHRIVSESAGAVAAELQSTIVMLDYLAARPVRVSGELRAAIAAVEGRILGV